MGERARQSQPTELLIRTVWVARTVFVHVDRVGSSRLRLRVGINLSGPQSSDVLRRRSALGPTRSSQRQLLLALASLGLVEQLLVPVQTLGGRSTDDGRDRSPLRRHELGQVQQLFVLGLHESRE